MDTFLWDRCGIVWGSFGNMWRDPCLIFAPPRTASCSDLSHLQPSPCCCDGDGLPSRRASHGLRQFCDVIDDFQIAFVSEVAIQLDLLFCDCSSFLRKHAISSGWSWVDCCADSSNEGHALLFQLMTRGNLCDPHFFFTNPF